MEADTSGDLKYCETVQNVALWVGVPGPGLNLPAVLENGGEGSRII